MPYTEDGWEGEFDPKDNEQIRAFLQECEETLHKFGGNPDSPLNARAVIGIYASLAGRILARVHSQGGDELLATAVSEAFSHLTETVSNLSNAEIVVNQKKVYYENKETPIH